MEKAFGYLRVSSKGQEGGDGFERQKKAIKDYAKAHNLKLGTIYEEVVSGTTFPLERPIFTQLLEALLVNGTKVVLVENLSRLARDLMVQETILRDFENRGLRVISVNEPDLATDDPSRRMIRQVLGSFHQYEKEMLVRKLRAARNRIAEKTGKPCGGGVAYGVKQGEADVLNRILADIKKPNYTANRIATELNRDEIKTRAMAAYDSEVGHAQMRPEERDIRLRASWRMIAQRFNTHKAISLRERGDGARRARRAHQGDDLRRDQRHQRLRLLHRLAHRGGAQGGHDRRDAWRADVRRRHGQRNQPSRQRLSRRDRQGVRTEVLGNV